MTEASEGEDQTGRLTPERARSCSPPSWRSQPPRCTSGRSPTSRCSPGVPVELSLLALIPLFAASEILAVHVETKAEAHSITFSEIPMVLALALSSPFNFVIGRTIGAALALRFHRKQSFRKLFFNVALFALESTLAIVIYRAILGNSDPIEPMGWAAALAALGAIDCFSAAAVTAVITMYSGWPGGAMVRRVLAVAGFAGLANICIGLGIAGALYQDARLAALVGVVAIVLYLISRSYTALSQRFASLETLHAFSRTVGRSVEMTTITDAILGSARELLRAQHAELLLLGPGETAARLISDSNGERSIARCPMPRPERRWSTCFPTDAAAILAVDRQLPPWLEETATKDAAALPLPGDDGAVGMLLVANRLASISTFKQDELALFETLANHASVALNNGHLFSRLNREVADRTHQALHDALTGLPNREHLDLRLAEAIATADRTGDGVAVLLLDLEGFKEVNDTLGHHTGDLVLRQVAARAARRPPSGGDARPLRRRRVRRRRARRQS